MGSPSCTRMSPRRWVERTERARRSCFALSGRPANRRILFTQVPFAALKLQSSHCWQGMSSSRTTYAPSPETPA